MSKLYIMLEVTAKNRTEENNWEGQGGDERTAVLNMTVLRGLNKKMTLKKNFLALFHLPSAYQTTETFCNHRSPLL